MNQEVMSEYDTDILEWSEHQTGLLRRLAAGELVNDQVDWTNVIEEIEGLGAAERSTLASRIRTIIEHLARLEASPAPDPRKGWQETILRTRENIEDVLMTAPSLRRTLGAVINDEHPRALRLVGRVLALYGETPRVPLEGLHYTEAEILGDWFPPDGA